MSVHVFATNWQPMTKFYCAARERIVKYSPQKRFHCHECHEARWAKNLIIQSYYDLVRIRCKEPDHNGRWT